MAKHRLTDLYVKNVRATGQRTDIWDRDAPGLVLRVSTSGAKTWMFFYRYGGKFRKAKIGNAHEITLASARTDARERRDLVHAGKDPSAQEPGRQVSTLGSIAKLFLERHSKRHKRTWREDERMLAVYVLPRLGAHEVDQTEKRDVLDAIEAVATGQIIGQKTYRGGLRMADRVLTLMRTMFGWAISEGLGSRDPTAGIRRRDKTSPRERMLNQNEIATFWNGLHEIYPDERRQLVAKLLLLTGQRKGEVLFADRSELHLEGAEPVWVLPGRRTKNKRVHVVPLSRAAVSLWRRAVQISSHDELVFHADGTMQKLAPDMMTKPLARAFCNHKAKIRQLSGRYATVRRPRLLSCEPFVPHDLRRTVASHMARLGIDRTVIGKCLNHVTADRLTITGLVYDRHDYADEKRAALTRWAAELDRLINAQAPIFLASATA